jgi:Viral BACON domain
MRIIRCPNCNDPLPAGANHCTTCGRPLLLPTDKSGTLSYANGGPRPFIDRPAALKVHHFFAVEADEPTQKLRPRQENLPNQPIAEQRSRSYPKLDDANGLYAPPAYSGIYIREEEDSLDDTIEDAWHSRTNWHRVVTSRSPISNGHGAVKTLPELPTTPSLHYVPPRRPLPSSWRHLPAFWICIFLLSIAAVSGLSGIVVVALGHSVFMPPPPSHTGPTLQITPASVALGAMITLHGSNFSPGGRVGLSYNTNIPIVDTGGSSVIAADKQGNFTDTVIVEPEWHAGPHAIHAEDALLHKIASFMLTVTGQSPSLRPAHLQLSTNSLDLGSGDQATNSMQTVTLTNLGGGQVAWQTSVTQPWLQLSPNSGIFAGSQAIKIVVAADRANLKVGPYAASVIFVSDAGRLSLPVKMKVTLLQPGHAAVLQLSPAVLSFSSSDGGAKPPAQVITVSNPGVQPLQWSITSVTSDASSWLSVTPESGNIATGGSEAVTVSVNNSTLLPGVYSGLVTFANSGTGPVKNSPQSVYVSLTVTPQCVLQVSPGSLTFASAYLQPAPTAQVLNVGVAEGCSTQMHWSAKVTTNKGGNWLKVNSNGDTSGVTPAHPSVGVNIAGLPPGTYTGAIIFSATSSTQTLPVTLTIGPPAAPSLATAPATLSFNAVVGQSSPSPQTITITNSGGGTLTWNAAQATSVGGSWLAITPVTGTLAPRASAPVTVTATLLHSLIPGTYNGTITITGSDSSGKPAPGSPQQIPVSFAVQAPCAVSVSPLALAFSGVIGQADPAAQGVTISAAGACEHKLDWTAAVTTASGGTWLTTAPAAGEVSTTHSATTDVGVALAGLTADTYTGTVSVSAVDHITHRQVGAAQDIAVTLTAQPPCTLQAPSSTGETFNAEEGSNPARQTFKIGVIGACVDSVIITPTVTLASGSGWLTVSPASTAVTSGKSATFTVTVTSAALTAASYAGSISLSAVNKGITIVGSPQVVGVTLNVHAAPALTVNPGSLTINITSGVTDQPLTISNTGDEPMNWTVALGSDAPGFVSLSATSGTGLAGGGSGVNVNVSVDATGVASGTYTTSLTISAIDPITGNAVAGSPAVVSITINVAPPSMQVSTNSVSFNATAGNSVTPQSITVTNTGGGILTWTANTSSDAGWLAVSPAGDSDTGGKSSTVTFTADASNLPAGTYTTTVTITPAPGGGAPVDVNITLTVT